MGEYQGGRDYPYQDTTDIVPPRGRAQHPAVLLVMLAAIVGLIYLSYQSSQGSSASMETADDPAIQSDSIPDDESQSAASPDEGADTEGDQAESGSADASQSGADDDGSDGDPADDAALVGPIAAIEPPAEGPFVAATLNLDAAPGAGLVTLSGRVPDQATADAVTAAANVSYAPFVESTLEVDESLAAAEWLQVAPHVIGLLPSVTDGTIMVADQRIQLAARTPNDAYLENLQGALAFLGQGMPVELVDSRVTGLEPPVFSVEADRESIALEGAVPSQQIIDLLIGGAAAAYDPSQVTNNLTVDDGTYPSFWMQTIPGIFQLFSVFPAYDFTVAEGQFSGRIQGGVNFAADSTAISPQAAQALDIGVAIMARDITVGMLVTGHTDSQGPDEYNQALSASRAQSVVDYFVAAGIDEARLIAAGAGESQPIADNETEEGRAQNRRVEFQFGPANALAGG